MRLEPDARIGRAQLIEPALALAGAAAVLGLLVSWRRRASMLAFGLIALTLVVAFLNDASFIGGVRPFDAGDDGLVHQPVREEVVLQLPRHQVGVAPLQALAADREEHRLAEAEGRVVR